MMPSNNEAGAMCRRSRSGVWRAAERLVVLAAALAVPVAEPDPEALTAFAPAPEPVVDDDGAVEDDEDEDEELVEPEMYALKSG
jgi:hypothetical protein